MVAVLGLFQELSANVYCGKIYTGNLCPRQGLWPEIMHCVCLLKKRPEQKVLKDHMTHPLSWENYSVPALLTVGHLGRGSSHTVGRHCWSCLGLFKHVHTPGYWVWSDAPPGIWKARNIIETRVPAVKGQNDVGKAVQSCVWPRPVAYGVVQKRELSVAICKT